MAPITCFADYQLLLESLQSAQYADRKYGSGFCVRFGILAVSRSDNFIACDRIDGETVVAALPVRRNAVANAGRSVDCAVQVAAVSRTYANVTTDVRVCHWIYFPFASILSVGLFKFAVQDNILHQRFHVSFDVLVL